MSEPLRLADFLSRHQAEIVEAWEARARCRPPAAGLDELELRDSIPEMLDHLAGCLGDGTIEIEGLSHLASIHAQHRRRNEFDLRQLVAEYGDLRAAVLERFAASRDDVDHQVLAEMRMFHRAIDLAIAESVTRYVRIRDRQTRAAEYRLRLAMAAAEVGTWDHDIATGQVELDARCRQLHGITTDEGLTVSDLLAAVHPDDRGRVDRAIRDAAADSDSGAYHTEYRTAADDERWLEARGQVLFDQDQHATRFLGAVVDISEKKATDEARERFVSVLGHDLRSPLGVIHTAGTLLGQPDGLSPEEQARLAGRIARASRRMERLVGDVLDFARGRFGGGVPIRRAALDMADLCREAVDEMAATHPQRLIELEARGDTTGDWDRERIMQALSNLLGNAIEHGRDPVAVSAQGAGDQVVVEVRNRGRISSADMAHLFEPFRLVHQASDGLGLGLYIVSEIVKAHGGTVEARSPAGGDHTAFRVALPRR